MQEPELNQECTSLQIHTAVCAMQEPGQGLIVKTSVCTMQEPELSQECTSLQIHTAVCTMQEPANS